MKARLRSDSGQTLVWLAVSLIVLLGIAALAVDVGKLYGERRRMQNAADAAALAGAHEICQAPDKQDAAIAMANDYAKTRNGALWATPVPFGGSSLNRGMEVTAGETVNNAFAVLLNANSTVVSAHAKARCEKTGTGCATWPLALDMGKFVNLKCNDPFVITFDPNFAEDGKCPVGCDCSHVFDGQASAPQYGWLSCAGKVGDPGCEGVSMAVGECVDAKPGVDEGKVGGGGAKALDAWIAAGNAPVRVPLFDLYNQAPCTSKLYRIGGFGCFVLNKTTPWIQGGSYQLPSLPGQTCKTKISKTLQASLDCTCTVSCGSAGGLPGPKDATIPVLFQ
jgi:Flp pilus assembly protein TadG